MIRTLIVDDDFRVADLHRAYVEKIAGFTVVGQAGTGAEALRMVATTRPDLSVQFHPYWISLAVTVPAAWWLLGRSGVRGSRPAWRVPWQWITGTSRFGLHLSVPIGPATGALAAMPSDSSEASR